MVRITVVVTTIVTLDSFNSVANTQTAEEINIASYPQRWVYPSATHCPVDRTCILCTIAHTFPALRTRIIPCLLRNQRTLFAFRRLLLCLSNVTMP